VFDKNCRDDGAVPALPPQSAGRAVTRTRRGLRLAKAALCVTMLVALAGCDLFSSGADYHFDIGANHPEIGLAFGDSISHGRDSLALRSINDAGPNEPGYRVRLEALFEGDGRVLHMYEDGEPGTISREGLARIDAAIAVGPAFMVILYGTNDANFLKSSGEVIRNLRAMAQRCRAQKIIVVLCTLPPVCHRSYEQAKIDEYNPLIRDLAKELGGRSQGVFLADLSQAFYFTSPDVCLLLNQKNGVHPTKAGYELIADTIYGKLHNVDW